MRGRVLTSLLFRACARTEYFQPGGFWAGIRCSIRLCRGGNNSGKRLCCRAVPHRPGQDFNLLGQEMGILA